MVVFNFVNSLSDLRLDIVGIVAVLGENCVNPIFYPSALSWHHLLPRLIPAPQALLRHERYGSLPTQEGMVIGVYNGRYVERINFFCHLLSPEPLPRNKVELITVQKSHSENPSSPMKSAFVANGRSSLAALSLLGCSFAVALIILSILYEDGFALTATVLLATTSTIIGIATRLVLDFQETSPRRRDLEIPHSDVVIYYPSGAMRIVRCDENTARLLFTSDVCIPTCNPTAYRLLALVSSVFLIAGLICMGNATVILQIAFAAAYTVLNICYWLASSAKEIKRRWRHEYIVTVIPIKRPNTFQRRIPHAPTTEDASSSSQDLRDIQNCTTHRNNKSSVSDQHKAVDLEKHEQGSSLSFHDPPLQTAVTALSSGRHDSDDPDPDLPYTFTSAIWTAIALTGTARWLSKRNIVPDTEVWSKWVALAERRALSLRKGGRREVAFWTDQHGFLRTPTWDYEMTLNLLFQQDAEKNKSRPAPSAVDALYRDPVGPGLGISLSVYLKLKAWIRGARERVQKGVHSEPFVLDPLISPDLQREGTELKLARA